MRSDDLRHDASTTATKESQEDMARLPDQWRFLEGNEVITADGERMGIVLRFLPEDPGAGKPEYLVIEEGFLSPTDYYVPVSAVATYGDGQVSLRLTKEDILRQGWDTFPLDRFDE